MANESVFSMVGEYIITIVEGVYKLSKITDFRSLNKLKQACYLIVVSNIEIPNDKLKLAYELGDRTLPEYMSLKKEELESVLDNLKHSKNWNLSVIDGYMFIPVSFLSSKKAPFIVPHELYGIPMLRL